MALKTFKPVTPSSRELVLVDRSELWKGRPVKSLVEGKSSSGGRNAHGHITVRHRGGGHTQGDRGRRSVRCKQGKGSRGWVKRVGRQQLA